MKFTRTFGIALILLAALRVSAAEPDKTNPLFAALTAADTPTLVTYTPSQLDPRQEINQRRLTTSSIRADLVALRPAFDGLVLYGYHEACTPRSGKPVILKETGFPHAGKDKYTPATQQAFWSSYIKPGLLVRPPKTSAWVFHGVAFEAFDLPWKSEESKLGIEKSWGLMSQSREPYPAFQAWWELRTSLDAKR
jgi:hypothetical protein